MKKAINSIKFPFSNKKSKKGRNSSSSVTIDSLSYTTSEDNSANNSKVTSKNSTINSRSSISKQSNYIFNINKLLHFRMKINNLFFLLILY